MYADTFFYPTHHLPNPARHTWKKKRRKGVKQIIDLSDLAWITLSLPLAIGVWRLILEKLLKCQYKSSLHCPVPMEKRGKPNEHLKCTLCFTIHRTITDLASAQPKVHRYCHYHGCCWLVAILENCCSWHCWREVATAAIVVFSMRVCECMCQCNGVRSECRFCYHKSLNHINCDTLVNNLSKSANNASVINVKRKRNYKIISDKDLYQ